MLQTTVLFLLLVLQKWPLLKEKSRLTAFFCFYFCFICRVLEWKKHVQPKMATVQLWFYPFTLPRLTTTYAYSSVVICGIFFLFTFLVFALLTDHRISSLSLLPIITSAEQTLIELILCAISFALSLSLSFTCSKLVFDTQSVSQPVSKCVHLHIGKLVVQLVCSTSSSVSQSACLLITFFSDSKTANIVAKCVPDDDFSVYDIFSHFQHTTFTTFVFINFTFSLICPLNSKVFLIFSLLLLLLLPLPPSQTVTAA